MKIYEAKSMMERVRKSDMPWFYVEKNVISTPVAVCIMDLYEKIEQLEESLKRIERTLEEVEDRGTWNVV